MRSVCDRDGQEWFDHWQAMSPDELVDERFRLYDFMEDLDPVTHAWASAALALIGVLERRHAVRRSLRDMARAGRPDLDADAFADAFIALAVLQMELGECDLEAIVAAALQVGEARAAAPSDQTNGS